MEKSLQKETQKTKTFYYYEKELQRHEGTQAQRVIYRFSQA